MFGEFKVTGQSATLMAGAPAVEEPALELSDGEAIPCHIKTIPLKKKKKQLTVLCEQLQMPVS